MPEPSQPPLGSSHGSLGLCGPAEARFKQLRELRGAFGGSTFEQAINDGAVELDMVLDIGRLRSGDYDYVRTDIQAVVAVAHRHQVLVKVICENHYLSDEQKKIACRLSEEAGADFVKTSTGFAGGGATLADLRLMRESVSDKVQVKAAGGVRDLDMAVKVRDVGCTRFGATRTQTIMEECYRRHGPGAR